MLCEIDPAHPAGAQQADDLNPRTSDRWPTRRPAGAGETATRRAAANSRRTSESLCVTTPCLRV
jgi:hypothetical protein